MAWHIGKITECGGICALPKGCSMIATIRQESFDLTPLSPEKRYTPLSVAAHILYGKTRPNLLPGPGSVLKSDRAQFEQITEKTCRVSCAEFIKKPFQIKLKGVTHLGYRTIFIGGIRNLILISQIDNFLEHVRTYTKGLFPKPDKSEKYQQIYYVYGKNSVMRLLETAKATPHEIAILGEGSCADSRIVAYHCQQRKRLYFTFCIHRPNGDFRQFYKPSFASRARSRRVFLSIACIIS